MLRLLGIPVSDDDARSLIATLLVEGTPDALTAAEQLAKGVERGLYAVPTETIPALAHRCSGRADRLSPAARW